jgi:HlyD family secretion protein
MIMTTTSGFASRIPSAENARKRRIAWTRWLRRGLLLLLVVAIAAAMVLAWMPRPLPVEAATVERGPLRVTVDEDGQARVKDRYVVSAPLAGSLVRIVLESGDPVTKGDALARITPLAPALLDDRTRLGAEARLASALAAQRQARAQIERSRAGFDFAETDAARTRELFSHGSVARAQLDRAALAERSARAELESAKFGATITDHEVEMARAVVRHLTPGKRGSTEQLVVTAPITGRVLKVLHESEGVVQPGTSLIELGDAGALEITVDVLTSDAVRINAQAPVALVRWGGDPLEGRVRQVEPSAFTRLSALGVEEQRVNVLIDLTSPAERWRGLGDGYRVEAQIAVWEDISVVKAPAAAVFRRDQGWAVFRVDSGTARLIQVELGHRASRDVEILRGLEPGERVILHPSDSVADGIRVAVR